MRDTVERLLSDASGCAISVVERERLAEARGIVERLTLDPVVDGVRTVVAKYRALEGWSATNLATEEAALDALAAAGLDVGPRLVAGGARDGVLVLSDLGPATVERALFEGDRSAATAALVALATATAELNAAPVEGLGVEDTWTLLAFAQRWRDLLAEEVREVGFPSVEPAAADVAAVLDAIRSPDPASAALVHGDLIPSNAVMGDDGRCRLIDFEGAIVQHVGIDACMIRFPFAWYGKWARVPDDVRAAMESAYRAALPYDDATVDTAIAIGCAAMSLVRLQRLPRIADASQAPDLALRRRSQIVSTVDVTLDALGRAALFPELAGWLADLADAMRERWDEARRPAPLYPAFA